MPEHTIPESLIENIRNGRAALVVGAGIGVPSWKQLLERMNERLRTRANPGDEAAAKDLDKLLHKGSLVRAVGFLARSLGEEVCDEIVKSTWRTPETLPPIASALGKLPFRQIWTTFPGDLLEVAAASVLPPEWPELRVATYQEASDINPRRRTLVKVLGNFDSYVVTPRSVRKAIAGADELRNYMRDFYNDGSLVFVGFRYGDPDLAALLDRLFGFFEPPENDHYLIASGVGPVTIEELHSEHHFQTINLAGRGADDTAQAALLDYLDALRLACESAGVSLAQRRPDEDDLEGWIELLGRDYEDPEAQKALETLEQRAHAKGEHDRLIDIYLSKVELEETARGRAELLRKVADVYEQNLGDIPRAFTALTAAVRENPSDLSSVDAAERLADAADGWSELVADVSEAVSEIEERSLAASYWVRLGHWYDKKLRHLDYAVAGYREAIKLAPTLGEAYDGLAHTLRKQQRWADLADALLSHADVETDMSRQVSLYLALGELYETQLASTQKAAEYYEMAAELEDSGDEALAGLERLYRRAERWSKLAQVLESRALYCETHGDAARAQALRTELSSLRADKLGDLEGTIKKHEETLERDSHDRAALTALADLYDKAGRSGEYLRVLGTLAELAEGKDQVAALAKLASEVEKRAASPEQTVDAYEKLVELSGGSEDALRGLARALRAAERWHELVDCLSSQLSAASAPAYAAEIHAELADVHERELDDPHKAIEHHRKALELVPTVSRSLTGLARLYQATENWDRALEVLEAHAENESSADLWRQAGSLAAERLSGLDTAEGYFSRALDLDPGHVPTLMALAKLYRRKGEHDRAARQLVAAEKQSQNRDQRVALLLEAADLYHRHAGDGDRALRLYGKVLELDPEQENAAAGAVQIYSEQGRHDEALPILENLVASAAEAADRAVHLVALGDVLLASGEHDEAASKYDAAAELDSTLLAAQLGRSRARFEHAKASDDEMLWRDVAKLLAELSVAFQSELSAEQHGELWRRHGVAKRALGDLAAAEGSLRKALQHQPTDAAALGVLADVAAARGDHKAVVEARRSQLKLAKDPRRRAELLEQIGDVYAESLKQPREALRSYQEGIELDPKSHILLHKMLEIYSEQKQWKKAMEALARLADTETDVSRRAKYHYAAAVIARDELRDSDLALEKFSLTLDDDPNNAKAFEAIDKLLAVGDDYKQLARAYRQMIRRVGQEAPSGRLIRLWSRLGEICADHLDDRESAIAAFEVAVSLEPDNSERHEQLVNLYLEEGEPRREDAIRELQVLIQHQPDRAELFHALFGLYEQQGDLDRLFCLAQALVLLDAATPAQKQLYEAYRPKQLTLAKRRLTEDLWREAVSHAKENRHLSAIFSSMIGALAASTARPTSAYNLSPEARADLESDGRLVSKVLKYGTDVLGLELRPQLYINQTGDDGILVANTAEHGRLSPAVLVGPSYTNKKEQRELAFEVGKRLAYFRPERYVNYALQGLPKLQQAYAAVLAATDAPGADRADAEARLLAEKLRKTVPSPVLEQVRAVAAKLKADPQNGVLAGWRTATDLTANRVGLILCNDLETAARMVATESSPLTTLTAKDRLRDLIAYSASEQYFAVRRHLGLALSAEAGNQ